MAYKPKGTKGEGLRERGQDRGALKMVCVRIPETDEKLLQEYFNRAGYLSFSEGMRVIVRQFLRDRGVV